jgi:PAS domain S-box-containing protein
MTVSGPLRLLIVDDVREHAEAVAALVRRTDSGPEASIAIAESYDEALAAVDDTPFDLAFVDYRLGARNGLGLLRELRERGVDTPVILLTSHFAEEFAVEAMRAGAADYLSTEQLTDDTLGRSIRHTLALAGEERQRRHAETALRTSEERFRALVENNSDAVVLIDRAGCLTYITPSSQRHLGWLPGETLGRSIFEFVHADDREQAERQMAETLQHPAEAIRIEARFRHADLTWRNIEGIAVNRLDEPSVAAIVVTARDVTERQKLE